jgi:hypothetical protein
MYVLLCVTMHIQYYENSMNENMNFAIVYIQQVIICVCTHRIGTYITPATRTTSSHRSTTHTASHITLYNILYAYYYLVVTCIGLCLCHALLRPIFRESYLLLHDHALLAARRLQLVAGEKRPINNNTRVQDKGDDVIQEKNTI